MRAITEKAFQAFRQNCPTKLSNTEIRVNGQNTTLELHGNPIARKNRESGTVEICTGGWDTPTTKERLRPFGHAYHVKGELYLNGETWDGGWIAINP